MEINLVHQIAVGKKGGPAPVIYDIDWNPKPKKCSGKGAVCMIGCVSSFGTHVYYFPERERQWTTMVIKFRPSRKGTSVRWHKDGTVLASTSDPDGEKPGQLATLIYNSNNMDFICRWVFEFNQRRISSIAWTHDGKNLLAATRRIHVFRYIDADKPLGCLGSLQCGHLPLAGEIVLQAHPTGDNFFAAAPQWSEILVWGKSTDAIGWVLLNSIQSGTGIRSLSFSKMYAGLIAAKKGQWKFFHFNSETNLLELRYESTDEHATVKWKSKRSKSGLVSMAASRRGNYLASGGWGDTLLFHSKAKESDDWKYTGSRPSDVCYGEVRCIKFHPKDDVTMRIATGGSGFIHFWAVFRKTTSKVSVEPRERRYEPYYYNKYGDPDDVDVPTSDIELHSNDNIVEGEDEVVVEYVEAVEDDNDGVAEEDDNEDLVEEQQHRQQGAEGAGLHQMQGVEGAGSGLHQQQGVEGAGLSEWYKEISKDAQDILDQIDSDMPKSRVISLCQKILNAKAEVGAAVKKHN